MTPPPPLPPPAHDGPLRTIRSLGEDWLRVISGPALLLGFTMSMLALGSGLLVARMGTVPARLFVPIIALLLALLFAYAAQRARTLVREPRFVLSRLVSRVDALAAGKATRALSLLSPSAGSSTALAELHVARALSAVPAVDVLTRGIRWAKRARVVAIAMLAIVSAAASLGLFSLVEGASVLLSRQGVGLVPVPFVSGAECTVRPPMYLRLEEQRFVFGKGLRVPEGSLLTIRAKPYRDGRRLVVTDGTREVPMTDDGLGHVAARWPVRESGALRIGARFGDVFVPGLDEATIAMVPDAPPTVELEGAPRTVAVGHTGDTTEIPIRYVAKDDNGLREVHLVLRSGVREERRLLAKLDGLTKVDRGSHVLRTRDPFIRKSFAPVEVRIEARDANTDPDAKWGMSPSIVLNVPALGEGEALRVAALRELRDQYVDELAWVLTHSSSPPSVRESRAQALSRVTTRTLEQSYAGLGVPSRIAAIFLGKVRGVQDAASSKSASGNKHPVVGPEKAAESLVLVSDAAIRGLSFRDAQSLAKQLADVADDLATGFSQQQNKDEADRGARRSAAALDVIRSSTKNMAVLGSLGRELAHVMDQDGNRVIRASVERRFAEAELAARDLAARLRTPDPSFAAEGGRGGRGGGESGMDRGAEADEPMDSDEAGEAFRQAAMDIDQLAQDHAAEMGRTEQALAEGLDQSELQKLREEARAHAEAIREAAKGLPSVGAGSDSWTGKGASAREQAEQMARALEDANVADAVTSGQGALQALEEARRLAQRRRFFERADEGAEGKIGDARRKLDEELKWAESKLDQLKKRASERAAGKLRERGEGEDKLADRTRDLGNRGRQASLPDGATQSLEQAERSARKAAEHLRKGEGEKAVSAQREAQRHLERARQALGENGNQDPGQSGDHGPTSLDHTEIPRADAHKGPEGLRQRILRGLGQTGGGKSQGALRRYTEGLLR